MCKNDTSDICSRLDIYTYVQWYWTDFSFESIPDVSDDNIIFYMKHPPPKI